jgi:hypothetical protein
MGACTEQKVFYFVGLLKIFISRPCPFQALLGWLNLLALLLKVSTQNNRILRRAKVKQDGTYGTLLV